MPNSWGSDIAVAAAVVVLGAGGVAFATHQDDTGPILAFIGVILVALLTMYTTKRRQREALDAESDRLALQLQHDRQLHDLGDLRSVIEELILDINIATTVLHDAYPFPDRPGPHTFSEPHLRALITHQAKLAQDLNRLRIRLGPDAPILDVFTDWLEAMGKYEDAFQRDSHEAESQAVGNAQARLYEAAYELVRVDIPN